MKKLYFFLMAMMVAVVANAADYYLIGGFNNWSLKQANCQFEAQGDGTYVLDYAGTLTSGFKINDGTWANDAANFGGNSVLTVGETYSLQVGGSSGNIGLSENIENPHIVFNPDAATLLITGATSEAKVAYDLWGDWKGTGDWSAVALTDNNGKWASAAVTVASEISFGIRVLDAASGSQTDWISAAGASLINAAGVYDLQIEGTNFTVAPGTWNFTLDPQAMTLTVAEEGGVLPPVTGDNYYLVGGFNNWALEDASLKFTAQADGTYVLDYNGTLTSDFKINDGTWNGDANYGSNGSLLVVGELYELGWGDGCGNIGMDSNVENAHLVFDPAAKTLLITGATSEAKTAYDLWGDWNGTGAWSAVVLTEEDGKWSASQVEAAATIGFGIRVLDASTGSQTNWISAAGDGVISDSGVFDVTVEGTNFTLAPGVWSMTFDPEAMTLSVVGTTGVTEVEVAEGEAAYYTLQGVKVANPENGIYVKVVDGKASKVVVK